MYSFTNNYPVMGKINDTFSSLLYFSIFLYFAFYKYQEFTNSALSDQFKTKYPQSL